VESEKRKRAVVTVDWVRDLETRELKRLVARTEARRAAEVGCKLAASGLLGAAVLCALEPLEALCRAE
jgi:hypothetical protein